MKLMELFDTDGDGYVNFDEFLVGIRVSKPLLNKINHLTIVQTERQIDSDLNFISK